MRQILGVQFCICVPPTGPAALRASVFAWRIPIILLRGVHLSESAAVIGEGSCLALTASAEGDGAGIGAAERLIGEETNTQDTRSFAQAHTPTPAIGRERVGERQRERAMHTK